MLILHRALDEEKEKQMIICGSVTDLKKWTETILLMTMTMMMKNNMYAFGFVSLAWLNSFHSSFAVACFYAEAEGGTRVFVDISVDHAVIKCFFQLHRCCLRHRNRFRNQNRHLS